MKSNLLLLSLAGLLSASLNGLAQTDTPAASASTAPATVTNTTPVTAAPEATAPATNVAPATATTEVAPSATNAAPVVTPAADTTAAPVVTPTADTTAAPANTAAARDPNAVIPLIVMDEVPLTDAIKNLARQAGLNYMLDPKINYGGIGPDGRPVPQPQVSLRWENLTPDQALSAVLNNYNLTIVDDLKTHIARITIKDPAAPDPLVSSTIQLKYADPNIIVASIQTTLVDKRSKVVADTRTAQLVLLTTEKELDAINKLVAQLDTQTKQVLIEAKLVETSRNPTTSKGIDWTGTLAAQHIRLGNNPLVAQKFASGKPAVPAVPGTAAVGTLGTPGYIPGTPSTPGTAATPDTPELLSRILDPSQPMFTANTASGVSPSTFFLNADGVSAVLSFLNTDLDGQILSTPRAVTLDNQPATLSVTRAQPIFSTTAGTQGSPGGSTVTYTNVGTILQVTPHISANKTIALKVVPEVSNLAGVATKTVAGVVNQADIFDVRRIETQVLIPSGNTLVMGGLVSDSTTRGNIKVPLLGDLPLLGNLFRQENKSQDKKNLIIFITPTIVESEDFQPTQTDFLKSKAPSEKTSDFGAWDSGKPQDWSKLMHKDKVADADSTPKFPDSK
ncbi:MAG: Type and secretion system protein [Pedosphaera sp.]|nr:Type and secretion system protein [Pedosphaera sp.]